MTTRTICLAILLKLIAMYIGMALHAIFISKGELLAAYIAVRLIPVMALLAIYLCMPPFQSITGFIVFKTHCPPR